MNTAKSFADKLMAGHSLVEGAICLDLEGFSIAVRSNCETLIEKLGIYFAHTLGSGPADLEVIALESPAPDLGVDFVDWKREPGKTGRKDAFFDLEDARLIQKVRTGMVFLQSRDFVIAAGPCVENDNQVINFINAQYMNYLQQNGALICHASGLVKGGKCLGMAGFSGGGKSTLMLHMLERDGLSYLTNDRLFLQPDGNKVEARGIPKLPRINPGTILNNPTLRPMLSDDRVAELEAMALDDLWHLEEKHDVFVEDVYGEGKIATISHLDTFLILNWGRKASDPCQVKQVDLKEKAHLLGAVMKSPGPFYQFLDGAFFNDDMDLDPKPYLDVLHGITILEATGAIDFDYVAQYCLDHLDGK